MKIRKAVFPAAGFGTRFLPVTKAQPKEMLPIVDKPVIQYLVEEAVASGIEEIIIVTGRGKRAIEDHFDYSYELEQTLVERGKRELIKEVRAIAEMAKFVYVRQPKPLGDGHAILCAKEAIGREPFAVLFGDDLVDSQVPALKQLIDIYEKKHAPIIGLEKIDRKNSKKYGIIESDRPSPAGRDEAKQLMPRQSGATLKNRPALTGQEGRLHRIKSLVEKPAPLDAPSDLAIIGKYILTPEVLDALENAQRGRDGEIRLINAFQLLVGKMPLYGYEIEGRRYDTGDKLGFLQATIDFALKRKDLGPALEEYMKGLFRKPKK
ncbi:UTP--glucose-1-phosphate uridylyltransferase [Candidatus Peregrinibacteria bacterium]|nr:UTP--glucose-1-phosphate uridylyltransferase [Candidatus Peregrinibacteria bacterium]